MDNSGAADSGGTADGADGRDDSLLDDVADGLENAAGDAGRSRAGDNSFQRMLDNARVHDTDGDLTDGENSAW